MVYAFLDFVCMYLCLYVFTGVSVSVCVCVFHTLFLKSPFFHLMLRLRHLSKSVQLGLSLLTTVA